MAEIPTMQKITIRLQKVKYNNKNYAINPDTNILYDYNLAIKEKTLKPVGIVKLNLETFKDGNKRTGTVMFDDKHGRDSMLQMVKSDLDKVNEKVRLEQLHREYAPGGPGAKRAEQEFRELVNMLGEGKGGRKNTKRKQKRKRKATRARRGGVESVQKKYNLYDTFKKAETAENKGNLLEAYNNYNDMISILEDLIEKINSIESLDVKTEKQKQRKKNIIANKDDIIKKWEKLKRDAEQKVENLRDGATLEADATLAAEGADDSAAFVKDISTRLTLKGGARKRPHKRRKSKKSSRKSTRRKSIRKGLKRNIEVKGLEGLAKLATSLVGDV